MKNKLIVIEGFDFVGKTTIAKALAKKLTYSYHKTPADEYRKKCFQFDKKGIIYNEDRLLLYLESVKYSSQKIKSTIEKESSVIVDRWHWTTLAYHFANNHELFIKWIDTWESLTQNILKPDISILLDVNDDNIWIKRMTSTGLSEREKGNIQNKKIIYNFFLKLNPEFIQIDNSNSREDTINAITDLIYKK